MASSCIQFWGCPGSINNWASLEECKSNCEDYTYEIDVEPHEGRCQLPALKGPCRSIISRYYFNTASQRCDIFTYGGCQGNSNNFLTLSECQSACQNNGGDICQLNNDPGPCSTRKQRYYFNSAKRKCEIFFYGGCLGNRNNFNTLLECHTACGGQSETNPCGSGSPLVDSFGRWQSCSFDISGQVCPFTHLCIDYRFGQKICCPKQTIDVYPPVPWTSTPSEICFLPRAPGNCRSPGIKYYYNSYTRNCETFSYTGCQGNKNNFNTKAECEAQCVYGRGTTNPCQYGTPLLNQHTGLEVQCGVCPYKYTCNTQIPDRPGVCCPQNVNNPVITNVNPCSIGSPLIDPVTGEEETCGFGISCPVTHECNTKIADRAAVCCPRSFFNTGK